LLAIHLLRLHIFHIARAARSLISVQEFNELQELEKKSGLVKLTPALLRNAS
jgi:hypothetical protein